MADLGQNNSLRVIKQVDFGWFLDGEDFGEVLLPKKQAPENLQPNDFIDVFLYCDSEDRVIATTITPKARVGECAYLKVVSVDKVGAFLDWGLPKDLLVPFSEQHRPMQKGYSYTVYLFVEEVSQRIAASSELERFLDSNAAGFRPQQAVELMIYGKSDLGHKAVVNGSHLGQLYQNEVFQHLHYGQKMTGYIKQLREDGKIDLMLQLPSQHTRNDLGEAIIEHLRQQEGVSRLTDKSPPEEIYETFGVSKGSYKKALGQLYKNRRILIEKHQISLLPQNSGE